MIYNYARLFNFMNKKKYIALQILAAPTVMWWRGRQIAKGMY